MITQYIKLAVLISTFQILQCDNFKIEKYTEWKHWTSIRKTINDEQNNTFLQSISPLLQCFKYYIRHDLRNTPISYVILENDNIIGLALCREQYNDGVGISVFCLNEKYKTNYYAEKFLEFVIQKIKTTYDPKNIYIWLEEEESSLQRLFISKGFKPINIKRNIQYYRLERYPKPNNKKTVHEKNMNIIGFQVIMFYISLIIATRLSRPSSHISITPDSHNN